ncbi:MAG: PH domain-containing protein [Anaerolineales bacterium]|nr:PH domain-containing protein [Anaerolineales bacterium]
MNQTYSFYPPSQAGIIFHLVCILALLVGGGIGLYRIAYVDVGPAFALYLLPIILAIPLVPFLIYRLSNLRNAAYILERDSIRFQWGLRVEVIPTNTILWAQRASDLTEKIRYPWLRWPGSVLGSRGLGGGTTVEFIASRSRDLILVATYERVYAISPSDPQAFLQAYQRLTELGSLISSQPQSVRPAFLLARVWGSPAVRTLLSISIFLNLALVVWVSLTAPTRAEVSLGFLPSGEPREAIPGVRLMLLPVLNTLFWVFNFFAGLVLFRRDDQRPLAFLLWGNSILAAGLFLLAVLFILRIS